jgi:glutaredoxin
MVDDVVSVEIYSRPLCHLCDQAKEIIERVRRRIAFDLSIIYIESDPELEKEFGEQIPVVFINGRKVFKYHVEETAFEQKVRKLWRE